MDSVRTTGRPWRSWAAIAFVLLALAVIQACDSGKHTGPTSNSSLQLKLRRVGGAEIPAGCTGVYSVTGPGVNIQNAALPASGQINFQGQIGQTYVVTVTLNCNGTVLTGSAEITLQPGDNSAIIQLTVSQVLSVTCNPGSVKPNDVSTCTCHAQSPGAATYSWSGDGVAASSSSTTTFSSGSPGNHTVTCTVNGVASGHGTVNVVSGDGTIQIFNDTVILGLKPKGTALSLQRRSFAQGFGSFFVRVRNVTGAIDLDPGKSTTVNVAPGPYQVDASCNNGFDGGSTKPAQVSADQTVGVHFDFFEDLGSCD